MYIITKKKKNTKGKNTMNIWIVTVSLLLIFILLLLVVRVSEISSRMGAFDAFLVDVITYPELVDIMDNHQQTKNDRSL